MRKNIFCYEKLFAISFILILLSGCLEQKSNQELSIQKTVPITEQVLNKQVQKENVKTIPIERISDEMDMLRLNGWGELSSQLGRTKAATVLWYNIKKNHNIETKIVFGNPNKLDSSIAILASRGGDSTLPRISIKGDEYYVINPSMPVIIHEFNYGYVFDDPRGADNFLEGYFSLGKSDHDLIEQWMDKSGVTVSYTDFTTK